MERDRAVCFNHFYFILNILLEVIMTSSWVCQDGLKPWWRVLPIYHHHWLFVLFGEMLWLRKDEKCFCSFIKLTLLITVVPSLNATCQFIHPQTFCLCYQLMLYSRMTSYKRIWYSRIDIVVYGNCACVNYSVLSFAILVIT